MSRGGLRAPTVAIACGGTGGHLFPGLAVGRELLRRGCRVNLLVSEKEVDQKAARTATGMDVTAIPAVGFQQGQRIAFLSGFFKAYFAARRLFRSESPRVILGMGGFTSAPPILAGVNLGVRTYLHESNTIPGRANRWLCRFVDRAFVGFPSTAALLPRVPVTVTGTPVREEFGLKNQAECRRMLGLSAEDPVLLVMGGSQGAAAINRLLISSAALLKASLPAVQLLHLSGSADAKRLTECYSERSIRAVVYPFFDHMETALGAASLAVSRSGASSLAEFAAARVPSILIPLPSSADNHQYFNARAFSDSGCAQMLLQPDATAEKFVDLVRSVVLGPDCRERMQVSLASWHATGSAAQIADTILSESGVTNEIPGAQYQKVPAASQTAPIISSALLKEGVVP